MAIKGLFIVGKQGDCSVHAIDIRLRGEEVHGIAKAAGHIHIVRIQKRHERVARGLNAEVARRACAVIATVRVLKQSNALIRFREISTDGEGIVRRAVFNQNHFARFRLRQRGARRLFNEALGLVHGDDDGNLHAAVRDASSRGATACIADAATCCHSEKFL